MRYLHAVSANEKFVASGEYHYTRDGVALAVIEKFTVHELNGGALLYRVDEDGRREDGLTILSEALVSPDGQFERFNVQSSNPRDEMLQDFKADYTFNPDYVQIGRQTAKAEREYDEFQLMHESEVYIKQTLYMGITLRQIMATDDHKAYVFAPQLLSVGENVLQKIIVQPQGTETLQVGRREMETRKFQIADDVFYWLDEHDIPIKRVYKHDDASYEVTIRNYAHR
ncbi:MAG: hypothetical protein AAFN11_05715 [Chloroflexota bacterium]